MLPWIIAWRVANALLLQTFFNPDEYWQGLEPAHRAVFGYGHLTWEWSEHVRSPIHALGLFAPVYLLLQWTGLDRTSMLTLAPKLVMAGLAAVADLCTYRLARRLGGESSARWALIVSLASWFHFFALTRALANSLETVLTVAALADWPWHGANSDSQARLPRALMIAALSVLVRPTALILWVPLGLYHLWSLPSWQDRVNVMIRQIGAIGFAACAIGIVVDTLYYGHITFTMWNFLKFNVVQNLSVFYGTHPWHWYASQGVPFVTTSLLPLAVFGYIKDSSVGQRHVAHLIVIVVLFYSLLSHKEFRFIHPILPLVCVLAGHGASLLAQHRRSRLLGLALAIQIVMAGYFAMVHQRGVIDAVHYLRERPPARSQGEIWFLMPCHSTPWQAFIHQPNATIHFVTCEPPPSGVPLATYRDESDEFYALAPEDAVLLWVQRWGASAPCSLHDTRLYLIMFDALLTDATRDALGLLDKHKHGGLHECARFFNSHVIDDARRAGDVVIWCNVQEL